jgi:hypothetical protein
MTVILWSNHSYYEDSNFNFIKSQELANLDKGKKILLWLHKYIDCIDPTSIIHMHRRTMWKFCIKGTWVFVF